MTFEALKSKIAAGEIDTVVVAFPDVFGRLIGKRFTGRFFLDDVVKHGTHGCDYLLTVNLEMEPQDGFALAGWDKGYGDAELKPDMATLRLIPWQQGTAMVLCDYAAPGGKLVPQAPRSVLKRQLERLANANRSARVASELELFLFNNTFHDARQCGYQNLTPSSDYRIDYHTMQTTRDEPLMRQIRNQMNAAGVPVEGSKGEWGRGQHELNFTYDDPLAMADMHVLFKQGVKEIAHQYGKSVSFMAKPWESEVGSSCHIHMSLWNARHNLFWDAGKKEGSRLFRQFLGGLLKYAPELCCFFAPTINSYKRYQSSSWAPTRMGWSMDNRTVGFRVVGEGGGFSIENRLPGADANPYLAFAAMLAAGMAGIHEKLDCGLPYQGNAYLDAQLPALPRTLSEALRLLDASTIAREALGDDVIDFYVHTAQLECSAFDAAVTDWERNRYFEQI
jgi:glutamine synthetase